MLLNFKNKHAVISSLYVECVKNRWQFTIEVAIDNWTDNLSDFSLIHTVF